MVDQCSAIFRPIVRMDSKTRPFVHQQDVLILIDNVQLRGRNGQIGIILPGLVEKFIVDIKLEYIAFF